MKHFHSLKCFIIFFSRRDNCMFLLAAMLCWPLIMKNWPSAISSQVLGVGHHVECLLHRHVRHVYKVVLSSKHFQLFILPKCLIRQSSFYLWKFCICVYFKYKALLALWPKLLINHFCFYIIGLPTCFEVQWNLYYSQ